MSYFLGIDTSCYTTSVAIVDAEGKLAADERKILAVKEGGRGLRQSEMVFAHSKNLPLLLEKACGDIKNWQGFFQAVGVSSCPRKLPDSYMPVFAVGESFARAIAAASGFLDVCRLSHQENHVLAGIWSVGFWPGDDFLAVHLSGGTTEIVKVRRNLTDQETPLLLEILGTSSDIHAGQFIDRVGVRLGLTFPCGAEMEKLAKLGAENPAKIPVAVNGLNVSFSGPETFAAKLLEAKTSPQSIAAGVELAIAESLNRVLKNAADLTGLTDILLVGGVASNMFIRRYLTEKLTFRGGKIKLYFPAPAYSPDNAVGAAYFAFLAANLKNASRC